MGDPRFIQHDHRLITIAKLDDIMFYDPPFCFHGSCKSFNTIMFVFVVVFTHLVSKCVAFMTIPHIWVFVDVQEINQSWYSSLATKFLPFFIWKLVRWSLKSMLKVLLMPWMLLWCQHDVTKVAMKVDLQVLYFAKNCWMKEKILWGSAWFLKAELNNQWNRC